jgi:hypothetical protein
MRKVLLATTALVALGGVSVANAADISISGNLEMEYTSDDTPDFGRDGHINVVGTTVAESGVTFEAVAVIDLASGDTVNVDDAYITISSSDMGTIYIGDAGDDANGMMDGALGKNGDIETQKLADDANTAIDSLGADITFISPSIAGFKIGVSKDLDDTAGAETSYALNYSMGGIGVYYGSSGDDSSMGVSASVAGFTIKAGSKTTDASSAKASDVAVKYTLGNGVTVAAFSASGKDSSGAKSTTSNVGASYSLADGVALNVETGESGGEDYTWVAVNMSF